VHRKVRKLKEIVTRNGRANGDNVVFGVVDETSDFVGVEMGTVTGPT
jgi:hypothetical protein